MVHVRAFREKLDEETARLREMDELDIPVAVLGGHDLIVAASPDDILVTHREASPRVKELVGNLNGRPMYEERR